MKKILSLTLIMLITLANIYSISASRLLKNQENATLSSNKEKKTQINERVESQSKTEADPKKAKKGPKSINTMGVEVDGKTLIDKAPYKLDRCDQMVAIETDIIPDFDDYTKRIKNYVTITAHAISRFEKKDVSKLEQAITLESMRVAPSEPQGAKNCIYFDGGSYEKPMIICLKNQEEYDSFIAIIDDFKDCRAGKALGKVSTTPDKKDLDAPGPQDLKNSCGFDGPMASPDAIINALDEKKEEEKQESSDFWIPGGHKVPGTKDEEEKKK